MGFSKITAPSLKDAFVQQIENIILSGELEVGEKLPAARELSIRMGVSRPVISAGLIELKKLGFVDIRPRQGVFVCDYRRNGTLETLVAIMRYNGGTMRCKEVQSLLETRGALECMCVQLLIERATESELMELAPILEELRDADDNDKAAEAVFRFHHEMAVLSGNTLLPLMYYSFKPQAVHLWALYCKCNGICTLYKIKQSLYTALCSRNIESAIDQTRDIMTRAIENLTMYGA